MALQYLEKVRRILPLHVGIATRILDTALVKHSQANPWSVISRQLIQYSTSAQQIVLGDTKGIQSAENDQVKTFDDLPGPRSYPVIGCLPLFFKGGMKNFHHTLADLRKKYGDVYKMQMMGLKGVFVGDPDIVRDLYRSEGKYPKAGPLLPAWMDYHHSRGRSPGIFVISGEEWWLRRKVLNPKLLKPKEVELYAPSFNQVSEDVIKRIMETRDGYGFIDGIDKYLARWSLEGVSYVVYEKRLGCLEREPQEEVIRYINAVEKVFDNLIKAFVEVPLFAKLFGTKARRNLAKALDYVYGTGERYIHEKLREFKEKESEGLLDEETLGQFIPVLYHSHKMSISDILSDINALMFASVETMSLSSTWCLYHLSQNQEKQDKLRDELKRVLVDDTNITPSTLQRVPYLKACIKESSRLCPVVPSNVRVFDQDVIVNGCRVPAGAQFFVLHDAMSRDSKYFNDPDCFIPERWLRSEDGKTENINPFVSLPFGVGIRMCLGRRLADLGMQILLAKIISQYTCDCQQKDVSSVVSGFVRPAVPLRFQFLPA